MERILLRTALSVGECSHRLSDRIGRISWRWSFSLFSIGFGKHCDGPLAGTVDSDGFDIVEWGRGIVRVRGRWATVGDATFIRLQPYAPRGFWVQRGAAGLLLGMMLAILLLALTQWKGPAGAACLVGTCAITVAVVLKLNHSGVLHEGKELARRLGVLFDADPAGSSDIWHVDTYFRE